MKNPYYRKSQSTSNFNINDSYHLFLDTMITKGYVIGLYDDMGWALCETETGQKALTIWNHKNLASPLIKGEWSGYRIHKVSLKVFLEEIIPYLIKVQYRLSLNLSVNGQNIQVNPEKIVLDLKSVLYKLYASRPDLYAKLNLPLPRYIRIHLASNSLQMQNIHATMGGIGY